MSIKTLLIYMIGYGQGYNLGYDHGNESGAEEGYNDGCRATEIGYKTTNPTWTNNPWK